MKRKNPPRMHLESMPPYAACGKRCAWNKRTKNLHLVTCKLCMGRFQSLADTLAKSHHKE